MKYILTLLILACLMFSSAGCGKEAGEEKDILAVVDGETITLQEFEGRLAKLPQHYQVLVEKNKKKFLEDLIIQKLLYKEAVATGVDKDPGIQALLDEAHRKIVIASFIQQRGAGAAGVTEDDMTAYYEENRDQFAVPARWQAAHILVDTLEEAREIKDALDAGSDFAEMAKERSKDSTGAEGGEIGFFSKGQLVPEFEEACFALKPGEISYPVKTKFGYHVIKLLGKEDAGIQEYKKVSGIIRKELERGRKQEMLDALFAELKDKAAITINEELLAAGDKGPPAAEDDDEQEKTAE